MEIDRGIRRFIESVTKRDLFVQKKRELRARLELRANSVQMVDQTYHEGLETDENGQEIEVANFGTHAQLRERSLEVGIVLSDIHWVDALTDLGYTRAQIVNIWDQKDRVAGEGRERRLEFYEQFHKDHNDTSA